MPAFSRNSGSYRLLVLFFLTFMLNLLTLHAGMYLHFYTLLCLLFVLLSQYLWSTELLWWDPTVGSVLFWWPPQRQQCYTSTTDQTGCEMLAWLGVSTRLVQALPLKQWACMAWWISIHFAFKAQPSETWSSKCNATAGANDSASGFGGVQMKAIVSTIWAMMWGL